MKLRSLAAFGVTTLLGGTALAQPAPTALPPPAPTVAPAPLPFTPAPPPVTPTARPRPAPAPPPAAPPPSSGWGSGMAPPGQPAPGQPTPPAQPLPDMQPAPQAVPPPQYPQGAYPQQPGAYPQGGYPGWGSEQAPMAVGPDGRPRLLPLEMKYDPDKGVPPGYRLTERRRTSVAVAGGSIFGGLWIASAIAGGVMEDGGRYNGRHGWPMYIPVLGPFITIASYEASAGGATPLAFLGLGQAAGVATFIYGMVSREKILKYQFAETTGLQISPVAAPLENGGYAGLQGTF